MRFSLHPISSESVAQNFVVLDASIEWLALSFMCYAKRGEIYRIEVQKKKKTVKKKVLLQDRKKGGFKKWKEKKPGICLLAVHVNPL